MGAWEVVAEDSSVLARFEESPLSRLWADAYARVRGARVEFAADGVELFPGTLDALAALTIRDAS